MDLKYNVKNNTDIKNEKIINNICDILLYNSKFTSYKTPEAINSIIFEDIILLDGHKQVNDIDKAKFIDLKIKYNDEINLYRYKIKTEELTELRVNL